MKTDPQHLLPAHLAFYRKRIFWGVVFGIFFIFSTVLFISFLDKNGGDFTRSANQVFNSFNLAYGAGIFRYVAYLIVGLNGFYIGSAIYFILLIVLGYQTFQQQNVFLKYPITLLALYITGLIPLFFLNGF